VSAGAAVTGLLHAIRLLLTAGLLIWLALGSRIALVICMSLVMLTIELMNARRPR